MWGKSISKVFKRLWGKCGGKVLQKSGLDHDLPRVSAPGGGGFASIDHLHFLLPHIPPRWGGSGIPLTHTLYNKYDTILNNSNV